MSARFPNPRPIGRAERNRYRGPDLARLLGNIGHDAMIVVVSRTSEGTLVHLYDQACADFEVNHGADAVGVYRVTPSRVLWRAGDYDAWEAPPAGAPRAPRVEVAATLSAIRAMSGTGPDSLAADESAAFVWTASGRGASRRLQGPRSPDDIANALAAYQRGERGL